MRTTEDPLRAAVVAWGFDLVRRSREQLQMVSLDQQIDDEGAAGLPLTVQAVAAMNEHRFRAEPVPKRAARAPALTVEAHAAASYDSGRTSPPTLSRTGLRTAPV